MRSRLMTVGGVVGAAWLLLSMHFLDLFDKPIEYSSDWYKFHIVLIGAAIMVFSISYGMGANWKIGLKYALLKVAVLSLIFFIRWLINHFTGW